MISIGEKIKSLRKDQNLSQVEFSVIVGISQGRLSGIEKNLTKPSAETLIQRNLIIIAPHFLISLINY